ncbi:hypothetical protein RIF29_25696 [Crotalaria pallida]|uniref:Uncharacterized protein n=1 Tax=Crotalaria pallida TaxID=3830 RepID=A0AAN9ELY1_CROPI
MMSCFATLLEVPARRDFVTEMASPSDLAALAAALRDAPRNLRPRQKVQRKRVGEREKVRKTELPFQRPTPSPPQHIWLSTPPSFILLSLYFLLPSILSQKKQKQKKKPEFSQNQKKKKKKKKTSKRKIGTKSNLATHKAQRKSIVSFLFLPISLHRRRVSILPNSQRCLQEPNKIT